MIRERDLYLVAGVEVPDVALFTHGVGDEFGELIHRIWFVGTDVENAVLGRRIFNRRGNNWRDIANVRERSLLLAIAEDGHRLLLQQLIHEDADDVAVAVADILPFSVDVVR